MALVKNPYGNYRFEIPDEVVDLLETTLQCRTDGKASNGIRWVRKDDAIPCLFFEEITGQDVSLYILPSTKSTVWRTRENLAKILEGSCHAALVTNIEWIEKRYNELRIKNIPWKQVLEIAPVLVGWIHGSQRNPQAGI